MKFAYPLLVTAALSGCSTFQNTSNELAYPTTRGDRQPINRVGPEEVSRGRNNPDTPLDQRVRRVTGQESGPVGDARDSHYSLQNTKPLTTRYVYGASTPVIVCAVGHVCDIELQPGEKVVPPLRTGDKVRWQLDLVTAGQGGQEVPHLTVMPLEPGIETSLIVITTKRTYHMFLRASRADSMLRTVFVYPDDLSSRWTAAQTPQVSIK
ncbi:TrbG/VirB9 family P-type conjugative transfer protein [Delftia sp. GW456-R20]|uniref:TrbG/VirB9 family P-type conjugative transfer protein n=1 Tax=Delftia sp. GW456-R20 TaxID=1827145 RepID=UPI0009EEB035